MVQRGMSCVECEAGELLDELGGRARVLRAAAPLPARRVRLLRAHARQAPAQLHARLQSC